MAQVIEFPIWRIRASENANLEWLGRVIAAGTERRKAKREAIKRSVPSESICICYPGFNDK